MTHSRVIAVLAAATCAAGGGVALAQSQPAKHGSQARHAPATPIRHVVVIYQENVSFDHYFGTYPHAANTDGHAIHPGPGRRPSTDCGRRSRGRCRRACATRSNLHHRPIPTPPNPQRLDSSADRARRRSGSAHLRPGPQLLRRAEGLRRRPDGPASCGATGPVGHRTTGAPCSAASDGLLRRQHRHRAVELRPALRHERRLLRHDVRALDPGRDQPRLGRHRARGHDAYGQQPRRSRPRPRPTGISPPTARAATR